MEIVVISVVVLIAVAAVLITLVRRRDRGSTIPFEQLSREDQVAAMENRRSSGAREGGHDAAKAEGTSSHLRNNWGGTP